MGGGLWTSQSLQLPWPSSMKHKQTNKQNPHLFFQPCLSKRKASQRPCETVVDWALGRLGWAWPLQHPKPPSASPGLQVLGLQAPPFIVYCPPGVLIPCQSGRDVLGARPAEHPCLKAPLIHFISAYPYRRTVTLCQSQPPEA